MSNVALNIVLFPPVDVSELCIKISQDIVNKIGSASPILNAEDRFPHITLMQLVIDESKLEEVKQIVEQISKSTQRLKLEAEYVTGMRCSFAIGKTKEIQALHERTVTDLINYAKQDVKAEDFYDQDVSEFNINWVKEFINKHSFENYNPHITLTPGLRIDYSLQKRNSSTSDKIAVCRLGSSGTCRETIYQAELMS